MGASRLPRPPSVLHWGQAWPGCWALCLQPQAGQHVPPTLTAQGSAWARRRGGCTVYTGRHGRLGWPGSPGRTAGRPRAAAGSPSALQGPRAVRARGAGTGPPSSAPPAPQHTLQEAGHVLQLRDAVFPVAAEPLQQLEGFQMLPAGVGSVEAPEGGVHLLPAGEGLRAPSGHTRSPPGPLCLLQTTPRASGAPLHPVWSVLFEATGILGGPPCTAPQGPSPASVSRASPGGVLLGCVLHSGNRVAAAEGVSSQPEPLG